MVIKTWLNQDPEGQKPAPVQPRTQSPSPHSSQSEGYHLGKPGCQHFLILPQTPSWCYFWVVLVVMQGTSLHPFVGCRHFYPASCWDLWAWPFCSSPGCSDPAHGRQAGKDWGYFPYPLSFFFLLAASCGVWDLGSGNHRSNLHPLRWKLQSLNRWTTPGKFERPAFEAGPSLRSVPSLMIPELRLRRFCSREERQA